MTNKGMNINEKIVVRVLSTVIAIHVDNLGPSCFHGASNNLTKILVVVGIMDVEDVVRAVLSRILGLTAFNSLLQCVNRLGFEICSVN